MWTVQKQLGYTDVLLSILLKFNGNNLCVPERATPKVDL
jgi:hypothetical protein